MILKFSNCYKCNIIYNRCLLFGIKLRKDKEKRKILNPKEEYLLRSSTKDFRSFQSGWEKRREDSCAAAESEKQVGFHAKTFINNGHIWFSLTTEYSRPKVSFSSPPCTYMYFLSKICVSVKKYLGY